MGVRLTQRVSNVPSSANAGGINEDIINMKKYEIIYADPPWSYSDKATSGGRWGGAENHYECMSIEQICSLSVDGRHVSEIAADDAILFLWTTQPFLKDCFAVMEAWGFEYVTCGFCWVKTNADGSPCMGLGNYTRGNSELRVRALGGYTPPTRQLHARE